MKKILVLLVIGLVLTSPAFAFDENQLELRMIELVNQERQKQGRVPYLMSHEMMRSSEEKALDMAENNYFAHTSPSGETPFDVMRRAGVQFSTAGENIARGGSVESLHNALMNSSGHRANILSTSYTHIGIGIIERNGTLWVAQHFAKQTNAGKDYTPRPEQPNTPQPAPQPQPEEPAPAPEPEPTPQPEQPTPQEPTPQEPAPEQPGRAQRVYIIRRGDTLWGISRRVGVPISQIVRINGVRNPNAIYEGQVIRISIPQQ